MCAVVCREPWTNVDDISRGQLRTFERDTELIAISNANVSSCRGFIEGIIANLEDSSVKCNFAYDFRNTQKCEPV